LVYSQSKRFGENELNSSEYKEFAKGLEGMSKEQLIEFIANSLAKTKEKLDL
jgi:hypothetical protein